QRAHRLRQGLGRAVRAAHPGGQGRRRLAVHAGQRLDVRLRGAGRHGRPARDELRAFAGSRVRFGALHRREGALRGVHPGPAPLGGELHGGARRRAHAARLFHGVVQISARGNVDGRRRPAAPRDRLRLHRLSPAVGPEGILGDGRGHEHRGADAVRGPARVEGAQGELGDGRGDAAPLLRPARPRAARADAARSRRAPVPRRLERDLGAAGARGQGRRRQGGRMNDWHESYRERYKKLKETGKSFFPYTVLKDSLVALLIFAALALLAWKKGAGLESLADPTDTTYNPRPEWYFLFLFQALKAFPGSLEPVVAVVLPGVGVLLLVLLPLLDRGPKRHPLDRPFLTSLGVVALLVVGALTVAGFRSPLVNPIEEKDPQVVAGRRIYQDMNCAYCHKIGGKGGVVGPALDKVAGTESV